METYDVTFRFRRGCEPGDGWHMCEVWHEHTSAGEPVSRFGGGGQVTRTPQIVRERLDEWFWALEPPSLL